MIWPIVAGTVVVLAIWYFVEKAARRSSPVTGGLHANISLPHEQEFELYHNALSHCARKTRLVMAELNIPYKSHPIDLIECGSYENISRAYLKVNPSGLVPTLVHNGHPIYESDDILAYAAAHAGPGAPDLIPDDKQAKDDMESWIARAALNSDDPMAGMAKSASACVPGLTMPLFFAAIRYIPFRQIAVGLLFHPQKQRPLFFIVAKIAGLGRIMKIPPVAEIIEKSREAMVAHLEALEHQLTQTGGQTGNLWILGDQFTLADISWTAVLQRIEETDWLTYYLENYDLKAVAAYFTRIKARPSWKAAITDQSHPIIDHAVSDLHAAKMADLTLKHALHGTSGH